MELNFYGWNMIGGRYDMDENDETLQYLIRAEVEVNIFEQNCKCRKIKFV